MYEQLLYDICYLTRKNPPILWKERKHEAKYYVSNENMFILIKTIESLLVNSKHKNKQFLFLKYICSVSNIIDLATIYLKRGTNLPPVALIDFRHESTTRRREKWLGEMNIPLAECQGSRTLLFPW